MASKAENTEVGSKRIRRAPRKATNEIVTSQPKPREKAVHAEAGERKPAFSFLGTAYVSERDVIVFLRQLIMLLDAGTPLLKALNTLGDRSERRGAKSLAKDMAQFVESGNPLWQAFARHPRQFSSVDINLVRASEASGTLVSMLRRLVTYREKRAILIRRVRGALIYPIIVLFVAGGVVAFISYWVLPAFEQLFEKMEATLPTYTVKFMATMEKISNPGFLLTILIILIALVVIYTVLRRTVEGFKRAADRVKLHIPYVGPNIVKKNAIVQMTKSIALLQRSGLSMLVTLELTKSAIHNAVVSHLMTDVRESVERGEGIEPPLRRARHTVPPVVTDMMVTGEESGQLDQICEQIGEAYEEEVEVALNRLAESLPVVITILLGVLVIMIVLAVFIPLVSMIDQIQGGSGA